VTGQLVLDRVRLHDSTVMQAFARTSPAGSWITAQVSQAGRGGHSHAYHVQHGDLTLTHLDATGRELSHMFLRGFGHGQSIAVQPAHPGLWIWVEAVSRRGPDSFPDGFGTQVARFQWEPGRTLWPGTDGVTLFDPHPGTWRVSPSVAGDLIGVKYLTTDGDAATSVHGLDVFQGGDYAPLRIIPRPAHLPPTGQGWALLDGGEQVAWLTGEHYSTSNPPPGDAVLTVYGAGGIVSQQPLTDGLGLSWREPEGIQVLGGEVYYGFAAGQAGRRRASIYRRSL
jgi:hypothetical protein